MGQLGALADELRKKREAEAAATAGAPTPLDAARRKAAVDGFTDTPAYKLGPAEKGVETAAKKQAARNLSESERNEARRKRDAEIAAAKKR